MCTRSPETRTLQAATLLAAVLAAAGTLEAAEFRLRSECSVRGAVVTLGDLADIRAVSTQETQRLAAMELFAAPPAGQQRYVRVRELQDLLLTRGMNLVEHCFSGSSQTLVTAQAEKSVAVSREKPLVSTEMKKATQQVQEALLRHLRRDSEGRDAWNIDFRLDDAQARTVLKATALSVQGGSPPWSGPQRFQLRLELPEGATTLSLEAQVSRPPSLVVAVRSLARGTVVHEGDVQLVSANLQVDVPDAVRSLDEVVGRETVRAIPEGRVVEGGCLRRPLLVQRGDPVTVYVRSAGIRIRTMARAKEEGSQGDLIAMESMQNRSSFFARVTGFQEAEVFAHAMQAEEARRSRGGR